MFLAVADDIRIIYIKFCDRLHNLRTLDALPENKRQRIAQETLEIYAPIAGLLGIWRLKWQLEDLCFKYYLRRGAGAGRSRGADRYDKRSRICDRICKAAGNRGGTGRFYRW